MGVLTKLIFFNLLVAFASSASVPGNKLATNIFFSVPEDDYYGDYDSYDYDFQTSTTEQSTSTQASQQTTTEEYFRDCTITEFQCQNEKCVRKYDVCNEKQDCDDGSDEYNCRYYWRNYDGSVPQSAILAWKDEISEAFIGRTNTEHLGVLVSQIYPGEKKINITGPADPEGSTVHVREDNIDILCSDNVENFVWHPTNTSYLQNLYGNEAFENFVIGGQETIGYRHHDLYICRILVSGQYIVGKLSKNYYGCWFAYEGKEEVGYDFDVLIYKEANTKETNYNAKETETERIVKK